MVTTDTTYDFRIREFGAIDRPSATSCSDAVLGVEYNALQEIDKYGRANPYADPDRGSIDDQVSPVALDVFYDEILANLDGPESIMGMSIQMYDTNNIPGNVGCCTIVRSSAPEEYVPQPVQSYFAGLHEYGSHSHSHPRQN